MNTLQTARMSLATVLLALSGTVFAAAPSRMIVSFQPGAAAPVKAAVLAARGAVLLDIAGMDAIAVELPPAALAALARNPHVAYVEEDVKRYPLALFTPSGPPYFRGQLVPYGVSMVQADQLPDTGAANRKLCIIDSGYDRSHEDLAANPAAGVYDSGTGWWYTDENHHGTHVAGTIAAVDNSLTGVVGVTAGSRLKLHIVKVFGASGWAYSSTLANAARQCGDAGANVISMSLGGGSPSVTERRAFDRLARRGVLSVAAAGNGGNAAIIYPAGYPSVLMVGALDEHRSWASFSQYNSKVELAAPGVMVLSTVPAAGSLQAMLRVGATVYAPFPMAGSPAKTASAPLADFGTGTAIDPAMAGKICLIARGGVSFAAKVGNCQDSGGLGAVIYNNAPGAFEGTLGDTVTAIPSMSASDTEGASLRGQLGQNATLTVSAANYAYYSGTSMATPHVSAVAALVWSYFPACTAAQIRTTLARSALDLGAAGRDDFYGYGLVQARDAYERIRARGCGA